MGESRTLGNLAIVYQRLGRGDEALRCCDRLEAAGVEVRGLHVFGGSHSFAKSGLVIAERAGEAMARVLIVGCGCRGQA